MSVETKYLPEGSIPFEVIESLIDSTVNIEGLAPRPECHTLSPHDKPSALNLSPEGDGH